MSGDARTSSRLTLRTSREPCSRTRISTLMKTSGRRRMGKAREHLYGCKLEGSHEAVCKRTDLLHTALLALSFWAKARSISSSECSMHQVAVARRS